MRIIFSLLTVLSLSSCVTQQAKDEQFVRHWDGKHIDQAIMLYGKPSSVTDLSEGRKTYEWNKTGDLRTTAASNGYSAYAQTSQAFCTVKLTTYPNGVIGYVVRRGNACE